MAELNGNGGSLCNLEYLLVNLGRDKATAMRLIQIYLEHYPTLCQRLQEAVMHGELSAMRDVLHDIRNSCVLFSGHVCGEQARDFESSVREAMIHVPTPQSQAEWEARSLSLCNCLKNMADELVVFLKNDSK